MIRGDATCMPVAALMVWVLSVTACVFDSHEVRTWVLQPKQQSIDIDTHHWIRFAFSEGATTVTVKIPPASRSFHG